MLSMKSWRNEADCDWTVHLGYSIFIEYTCKLRINFVWRRGVVKGRRMAITGHWNKLSLNSVAFNTMKILVTLYSKQSLLIPIPDVFISNRLVSSYWRSPFPTLKHTLHVKHYSRTNKLLNNQFVIFYRNLINSQRTQWTKLTFANKACT